MGETDQAGLKVHSVKRGRPPKKAIDAQNDTPAAQSPAQEYAMRIWSGQSPNLPRNERIARCNAGVLAQGMSVDGLEFPE